MPNQKCPSSNIMHYSLRISTTLATFKPETMQSGSQILVKSKTRQASLKDVETDKHKLLPEQDQTRAFKIFFCMVRQFI